MNECICTDFINCNPDPVPNPDCPIHGAMAGNEKTISRTQADAIFRALADANLWTVCAIEFPDFVEVVTRSMEQPAKRITTIDDGEHVTYINEDWELYSGSIYDNNTQG